MKKKTIEYITRGTCSRAIRLTLTEDNVIESVRFVSGCSGNTSGISALVKGMKAEDAIARVEGIRCGMKNTSCPDQLAKALALCMQQEAEEED
ncbi:MAG: TIGR03905 family TSCPD domain-containing protein [Clostridia bacterium]|nr:TIGR03905 family TSCPD domain-containing protein [Clostridia bacterium]